MAWRYWVTETVQTFDNKGVRMFRSETVYTFDNLSEAAETAGMAARVRPVVADAYRMTHLVVIEGQEVSDAACSACDEPIGSFSPPALHKCPNCGSTTVHFYDVSLSERMYCSACGKSFAADDGMVR